MSFCSHLSRPLRQNTLNIYDQLTEKLNDRLKRNKLKSLTIYSHAAVTLLFTTQSSPRIGRLKRIKNNKRQASEMLAEKASSADASLHEDDSESEECMSDVTPVHEPTKREDNVQIADAENNLVFWSRMIVLAVLVVSTVSVALVVYFYTSGSEEEYFEQQFISDSLKVFEAVGTSLDLTLGAADAFIVKVVSHARYSNSTWPFVTAPDFAVQAAKLLGSSAAVHCNVYPLVSKNQRAAWEQYSLLNDAWVEESINMQARNKNYNGPILTEYGTLGMIHNNVGVVAESDPGPYMPSWQSSPVVPYYFPYNWDGLAYDETANAIRHSMDTLRVVINGVTNLPDPSDPAAVEQAAASSSWASSFIGEDEDENEPMSDIVYPIINSINDVTIDPDDVEQPAVGAFALTFYWRDLIKNILPPNSKGVIVVFENTCEQVFTYRIDGENAIYVGQGDQHDSKYDYIGTSSTFLELRDHSDSSRGSAYTGLPLSQDFCPMTLRVYPSEVMEDVYLTSDPVIFTTATVLIFVFTSMVFFLYDWMVERRQKKVMSTAMQSSAIVSSLFPSQVRDRLFPTDRVGHEDSKHHHNTGTKMSDPSKFRMKSFFGEGDASTGPSSHSGMGVSPPVADLYPEATVLFADIAGFTAWSSVRDPTQVFTLLETLYGAFDAIARKRGVFKVETIGDSYVAVVGLPEPRKDHAVVMARFARDCRDAMALLTRELEVTLGPDTGNLQLRFGLHSGPVTAGVLRGEKSRFQLFGDTVNTAARMESNGIRNLIQVSQTTADLLIAAGKEHWVNPRDELVEAKGKGKMQTYWVDPKNTSSGSVLSSTHTAESNDWTAENADHIRRLVDWNADILSRLLRSVIAKRDSSSSASKHNGYRRGEEAIVTGMPTTIDLQNSGHSQCRGSVLDEVKEIIELPGFDAVAARNQESLASIELESTVATQLHEFVSCIAAMYKPNPFHNFEHASHVTMSVVKLLGRIIAPKKKEIGLKESRASAEQTRETALSSLHDHTYGITSDPLTQFACVFAALIHDVDHPGVPNAQLVKENVNIATAYHGKSVAEQNSVDLAWNLFMEEQFSDLRRTLCSTDEEMRRFRQLVVNSVMATDIMDSDLKTLRDGRWGKAFQESPNSLEPPSDTVNRKATIVIEHLIQASDIAHTMQHWHIYRKWNEHLFEEMYEAYLNGRAEKDPSEFWYQGEIGFFDFYIIPLAKKLDECGVFGVSSNEYLNYALKNRQEWEDKGKELVEDMLEKYSASQP
jgi:class 3 adenylate cyclase